ncbi:MAG: hypothetical protein ACLGHC_09625 [Alphaproteobacteria bacterium]
MRSVFLAALLFATTGAAAQQHPTSAYTRLDLDSCKRLDPGEDPSSATWRCAGYANLALFVRNADDRYDLDAGIESEEARFADTFDYPGETVEWRLFNGTPFAMIYRLKNANPDKPPSSILVVESVGRGTKPGCRVAEIPGSRRNANEEARKIADQLLATPARCLPSD